MASVIKVDRIQSDTGVVNLSSGLVYVDQNNRRVGIGNTSPSQILEVTDAAPRLNFISTNNDSGIRYNTDGTATNSHRWQYQGVTQMGLTSGGTLDLPYGQLKFPATQNASSDANTLDDYEEGTFTPVFDIEGGGTITASGTTLYGLYTKVGRLVTVNLGLTVQSTSGSGAGNALQFGGLPFTSANINNSRWPITVRLQSAVSSSNYWSGSLASNETGGRIEAYNGTTLINSSTFIGNATIIHITIVYYTT